MPRFSKAAAAGKILKNHSKHFKTGGFRSNPLVAKLETLNVEIEANTEVGLDHVKLIINPKDLPSTEISSTVEAPYSKILERLSIPPPAVGVEETTLHVAGLAKILHQEGFDESIKRVSYKFSDTKESDMKKIDLEIAAKREEIKKLSELNAALVAQVKALFKI